MQANGAQLVCTARRGYLRLEACEGTLARCRFWCHGSDVIEMLSTAGHYLISTSQLQAFHVRHLSSCQRTLFQPLNLSTRQLTYPHDSYIDIRIECELANSLIHSTRHLKDYWFLPCISSLLQPCGDFEISSSWDSPSRELQRAPGSLAPRPVSLKSETSSLHPIYNTNGDGIEHI